MVLEATENYSQQATTWFCTQSITRTAMAIPFSLVCGCFETTRADLKHGHRMRCLQNLSGPLQKKLTSPYPQK